MEGSVGQWTLNMTVSSSLFSDHQNSRRLWPSFTCADREFVPHPTMPTMVLSLTEMYAASGLTSIDVTACIPEHDAVQSGCRQSSFRLTGFSEAAPRRTKMALHGLSTHLPFTGALLPTIYIQSRPPA